MVAFWMVQEIRVQENWKCASVETPKVSKLEDMKWWVSMTSPEGDVDLRISKVM
jgi:hypothetical protein